MKKRSYSLLLILLCLLFYVFYHLPQKKIFGPDAPFAEFVFGKWKGETTLDYGSFKFLMKLQLKFSGQDKLEYCSDAPGGSACYDYKYHLMGDNIFELESVPGIIERRNIRQEWKIIRDGDHLLIWMSTNPRDKDNRIIFTRDDTWWPF